MKVLDCENYNSAINSIANIYNIPIEEIQIFFHSFDIDNHYEVNDPQGYGDEEIQSVFESSFRIKPGKIDKVCWFHLTRCLPKENFLEGILPLTMSLDKVWQTLFHVFSGKKHYNNLKKMKLSGVDNRHYNLKAGVEIHSGPYAMLVRDSAFHSQNIGNHDYLRIPEIFEDICNGYEKQFGESIIEILQKKLLPKIVKFVSDRDVSVSKVGTAMYYAYRTYHKQGVSFSSTTCFDGENSIIPYEDILKVETISV